MANEVNTNTNANGNGTEPEKKEGFFARIKREHDERREARRSMTVLETGNGDELFLDLFSNTIFRSSEAAVKSAISDFQENYRPGDSVIKSLL